MKLPLLTRLTLFDVYTGGQVGAGRRSLAWSLTFQAPDRTLTDKEVNELHAKIVAEVGPALRGRGPGGMTMAGADGLAERLEQLEKSVRRAAEAIARLRRERETLQARVTQLEGKLAGADGDGASCRPSARSARKCWPRWTACSRSWTS